MFPDSSFELHAVLWVRESRHVTSSGASLDECWYEMKFIDIKTRKSVQHTRRMIHKFLYRRISWCVYASHIILEKGLRAKFWSTFALITSSAEIFPFYFSRSSLTKFSMCVGRWLRRKWVLAQVFNCWSPQQATVSRTRFNSTSRIVCCREWKSSFFFPYVRVVEWFPFLLFSFKWNCRLLRALFFALRLLFMSSVFCALTVDV